jgi:hypothetical protein
VPVAKVENIREYNHDDINPPPLFLHSEWEVEKNYQIQTQNVAKKKSKNSNKKKRKKFLHGSRSRHQLINELPDGFHV